MNGKLTGILLILIGFVVLIFMGIEGMVQVGLFLFIPFVVSTSAVAIIPFIIIFLGIILIFISVPVINRSDFPSENSTDQEIKKTRVGGFIMIGPVPIIFGNDKKLIYISLTIATTVIVIYLLFMFNLL